ncbi:hypothetical protein VHUM_03265 [Vanrija humicola]|uniref:Glutathione S-transferase n=1 Tax=Vanrija humicola TaxID=5417 RepID=A0A7D8UX24_VANHU|nr:hypothetical protein VHUM_03265 [Vanrija humicola]
MSSSAIKIWGRGNSANVKRVLWAAEELGVAYESVPAGGAYGRNDELVALGNPTGLVPTLQDGDFVLWESAAIVRYLGHAYGAGSTFFPDDAKTRAAADKWVDWTPTFFKELFPAFIGLVRTPEDKRDPAAIAASIEGTAAIIRKVVEPTLAKQDYFSGKEFGFGDVTLGALAYIWFEAIKERPALPGWDAWYARVSARPAFKKVVAIGLS